MPSKAYLILRSARRARLEGRMAVLQPFISTLAQPLRSSALRILQHGDTENTEKKKG
jgi:hypothetical protein